MSNQSQLGATLRKLRKEAGVSGMEAATKAGTTQSTISRVERGLRVPTVEQVEALCHVYGVAPHIRRDLIKLTREVIAEESSHRVVLQPGTWRMQQRAKKLEAASAHIRAFHPAIIIGLLQTRDYIRALYGDSKPSSELDQAISLRLERQRILKSDRQFTFVMAEGALRWQIGSPSVMVTQLEYLNEIAQLPNIKLGLIPWTTPTQIPSLHGFHMYDRTILITTQTATAFITHDEEVNKYENIFAEFEGLASFDNEATAIIKRIAKDYRSLI